MRQGRYGSGEAPGLGARRTRGTPRASRSAFTTRAAATSSRSRVIVPAIPGALSALGILMSNVVKDYSRTLLWVCEEKLPTAKLATEFKRLETTARREFKFERWPGKIIFGRWLEMRYAGQGFELSLPASADALLQFQREHERKYGYSLKQNAVEIVNIRLRSWIETPAVAMNLSARQKPEAREAKTLVNFAGKAVRTPLIDRGTLTFRKRYQGPAIVVEYSATTFVPPGWTMQTDKTGNLILELNRRPIKRQRKSGRP